MTSEQIGDAAAQHRFALHELIPEKVSLEEAFMDLTREETEFRATTPTNSQVAGAGTQHSTGADRQERIAA